MKRVRIVEYVLCASIFLFCVSVAEAATLRVSPDTGVYTAGNTFSVRVVTNTQGDPINAAEGELTFNTGQLSVVNISKAGSIFTLWTREPEFSNSTGKIFFGGGSPSGYTGSQGTIMTVTFMVKSSGTGSLTYSAGSILAADGKGTNILTSMQGGSFTLQARTSAPPPEYVPPANTPLAPKIVSSTHPNENMWYREKKAVLTWQVPDNSTGVRTLLDTIEGSIPTELAERLLDTTTLDLQEGISYFHIQFKNTDGWGRIAHRRLAVDSQKPESFVIRTADHNDPGAREQKIFFDVKDTGSGLSHVMVQLDGGERIRFEPQEGKDPMYTTPPLEPGSHTLVAEAFDQAGNSIVSSFDFVVEAFAAPIFTEYPTTFESSVIPVVRGTTRPSARVVLTLTTLGAEERTYEVTAMSDGTFTFIPEGRFSEGVHELFAVAFGSDGSQSARSETIRMIVREPGLVRIGTFMVNLLSILIPLIALVGFLAFIIWYGLHRMRLMRRRLRKEVVEAEESLVREFDRVVTLMKKDVDALREARKGKLTKQEEDLVVSLAENLQVAEHRIEKEIRDIEKIIRR